MAETVTTIADARSRIDEKVGSKVSANSITPLDVADSLGGVLDLASVQGVLTSQFIELLNSQLLTPGQWYRITDYNSSPFVANIGGLTTESSYRWDFDLLVFATGSDTFSPDIYLYEPSSSLEVIFSQFRARVILRKSTSDRVYCSWVPSTYVGFIITYMEDKLNDVSAPFDFLNILIPRFAFGEGLLPVYKASGGASYVRRDVHAFSTYQVGASLSIWSSYQTELTSYPPPSSIHIPSLMTVGEDTSVSPPELYNILQFPNIVCLGNPPSDIHIGEGSKDSTFCGSSIVVGNNCHTIFTGPECKNLHIGNDSYNMLLAPNRTPVSQTPYYNFKDVKIGNGCFNLQFGNDSDPSAYGGDSYSRISIEDFCSQLSLNPRESDIRIGAEAYDLHLHSLVSRVEIGSGCRNGLVESGSSEISIGNLCENFIINQNCSNVKIGDLCKGSNFTTGALLVGISCEDIVVGNRCGSVRIGTEALASAETNCSKIRVGDNCSRITIGKDSTKLVIDSNCVNIWLVAGADSLHFKENFDAGSLPGNFDVLFSNLVALDVIVQPGAIPVQIFEFSRRVFGDFATVSAVGLGQNGVLYNFIRTSDPEAPWEQYVL